MKIAHFIMSHLYHIIFNFTAILEVPPQSGVIEVIVELLVVDSKITSVVKSWNLRSNVQAMITPDDCFQAESIAKKDSSVINLLKTKYNITDLDMLVCDPWSIHATG